MFSFKIGKSTRNVDRGKVAGIVTIPAELPKTIANEEQIKPLRKTLDEMKAFAAKFPKSETIMRPYIEAYSTHVKNFDTGMVRYESKWITKAEYAPIKEEADDSQRAIDDRERRMAALRTADRKSMDEFAAKQRAQGLEEYNGLWLPVEEVRKLVERDRINAGFANSVDSKTIAGAIYSVFQVTESGFLIEVESGQSKQGGINSSLAYLVGVNTASAADGDAYRSDLFWCGNYTYVTRGRTTRTVNSYCLNRNDAITRLKNQATNPGGSEVEQGGGVADQPAKHPDVGVLAGAKASGSGFFVGSEGYLITNEHVVHGAKSAKILLNDSLTDAEIITVNKTADLALLKVAKKMKGLAVLQPEAKTGLDVFAIGFPQPEIQGKDVKVTKGIISGGKGFGDDETRFQIDAAVQPGNSGGPLCDSSGNLVGVVVAGLDQIAVAQSTGTLPQNVNYAIKASQVLALLKSKSVSFESVDAPATGSAVDAMERASDCTVLVVAY